MTTTNNNMTYNYTKNALELFKLPEGENARKVLDYLWSENISNITLLQYGEGDTGEDCDVQLDEDYSLNIKYKEQEKVLDFWMYEVASHLVPGYEINDGGRVEVTFTRDGDNISYKAEGWTYYREESLDYSIKESFTLTSKSDGLETEKSK
jgi:hypothetical protein